MLSPLSTDIEVLLEAPSLPAPRIVWGALWEQLPNVERGWAATPLSTMPPAERLMHIILLAAYP